MHEKSLAFFPRSHNYNLNFMCKSIWNTNYARWKAHTHTVASDWHHPTAPHKTWNSVLWALREWSPPSSHIMLWHFPTAARLLLNRQRQLRNVREAELEAVKPTMSSVQLSRAMIVLCSQHLCPETAPCSGHGTTVLATSPAFKNHSK